MSDSLETLFQNMGPYVPALWAGQREGLNNQAALQEQALQVQRLKDAQQTYAQKERTNPLEVINKQYTNEGLAAENPGKVAQSELWRTKANTAAATQAGDIAKTQSGNALSLLTNKANQSAMIADELGKAAASVSALPAIPGVREAALNDYMERLGVPKGQYGHLLANVPPDQIPKKLMSYSDSFRKNASSYKTKMEEEQLKLASHEKIAAGNNATTRYVADQKAEIATAKQEAAEARASHSKGLEADIAKNLELGRAETDPAKQAIYFAQAAQSAKLKAEITKYGTADIGATAGIATNPISPLGPVDKNNRQRSPEAQAALEALRKK
jgi:hypothetical protein